MKNRPLKGNEPKSEGCGSVNGYRAGTAFGGRAEKAGNKRQCWWAWIMNIVGVIVLKISKYKNYYVNNAHVHINVSILCIATVRLGNCRISFVRGQKVLIRETFYEKT